MNLLDLISRLQYLATLVDNPEFVNVLAVDDFNNVRRLIKRVEFNDEDMDFIYLVF